MASDGSAADSVWANFKTKMNRKRRDQDSFVTGGRKRRHGGVSEQSEIEDRFETLIERVGEKSTSSLESNLEGLVSVLEADLNTYKSKILRILSECAVKMPEKCSIYSTLVGLLNAKNYNFGGEFVELCVRNLKDALKAGKWEEARFGVRFLSDLVNCHVVSSSSLLHMYDCFVDAALEPNVPQVRKDWYMYSILSALPWIGRELYEKKEHELDRLLKSIETFLSKRSKIHVASLRVWSSLSPHPQEEYLDCLWAQIRKLKADGWQERHIQRPYLAFDSVLSEALQNNIPNFVLPPHQEDMIYPQPTVVFRMFDYTDCPESGPVLPGTHSVERHLIEEHLHQTIERYHIERKELATQLLAFPQRNKIPIEYMIVEVMFAELFNMPNPRYLEVCYGSTLIELCKLQPSTMPQVLAQATELLYERIDTMNVAAFDRFVNWFAYHLSNFQYRWSWEDWAGCLMEDRDHPKPRFVAEVLAKGLRLSYYSRVSEMVSEGFAPLLPPKPIHVYKFEPGVYLPVPGKEDESDSICSPYKIDVFVQTLLHMGHKTFTHAFAALAKFYAVFKALGESEEAQICILKSTYEVWNQHPQFLCVLVDKMLKTQIVECSAVANWLFSKEMSGEFTKTYVWELLHLTIRKMSKHVIRLERELQQARDKLRAAQSESEQSEGEGDGEGDGPSKKKRVRITTSDPPTEEVVERMEEKLEAAQSDQKNLFLIIFQRFIMILSEHLVRCDTDGVDFGTYWYRWTVGRLQQVFMAHNEQVEKYSSTLETLLFTHDLDNNILDTFRQFQALRA
nr:EOG090X03JL [Lepidurus arcticus]